MVLVFFGGIFGAVARFFGFVAVMGGFALARMMGWS